MLLTLFALIQSHSTQPQSTKISWLVWAGAIFVFLLGLGMLIYVMTRPKITEDEEVEGAGRGLLAAEENKTAGQEPPDEETLEGTDKEVKEVDAAEVERPLDIRDEAADGKAAQEAETKPLFEMPQATKTVPPPAETKPLVAASDDFKELRDLVVTLNPRSEANEATGAKEASPVEETMPLTAPPLAKSVEEPPAIKVEEPPVEEDFIPPPVQQDDGEEPLPASAFEGKTQPFGSGIADSLTEEAHWESDSIGTEVITTESASPAISLEDEPLDLSPALAPLSEQRHQETQMLSSITKDATPDAEARVAESRAPQRLEHRDTAESSELGRPKREPFEPPRIEPITPKDQQTARQTKIISSAPNLNEPPPYTPASGGVDKVAGMPPEARRETRIFGSGAAAPVPPEIPDNLTAARPASTLPGATAQKESAWAASSAPPASGTLPRQVGRKPAGAVLGLPAERSDAPLVLGAPVLTREEIGVTGLTHYGKEKDDDTGRGGLIVLAVVILLLGGALASYFFVPAVKERANKLLGIGGNEIPPAEKPKAQVIPSRAMDFTKNIVKARGAVINISDETLEGLSVEITFMRGEGAPVETKVLPVKPDQLAPQQQGLYEFEYDGSKATGYSRYRVSKLITSNGEVKFTTPNQQ